MTPTAMAALACSCILCVLAYVLGSWRGYLRGHLAASAVAARTTYISHAAVEGASPEAIAAAIREVEGGAPDTGGPLR